MRNSKVPPKGQPVPFRGPMSTREIQIDPELAATLGRLAGEQPLTTEGKVNQWLGDPKGRAASYSESLVDPNEDPVDNVRHPLAAAYTTQAVADKIKYSGDQMFWNNPIRTAVANAAGVAVANAAGLGHEVKHLPQLLSGSWEDAGLEGVYHALRMTGEDLANNFVGSLVGTLRDLNGTDAAEVITFLSNNNLLPDGVSVPSTSVKAGTPENFYLRGDTPINKYE